MSGRPNRTVWILVAAIVALVAVVGVLAALLVFERSDDSMPPTTTPGRPTTADVHHDHGSRPSTNVKLEDGTVQQGIIQRQYLVMSRTWRRGGGCRW